MSLEERVEHTAGDEPVRNWFTTVSIKTGLVQAHEVSIIPAVKIWSVNYLFAVGSLKSLRTSLMMHRTSVIASITTSVLEPIFRVLRRLSRTASRTLFISDWWEICVANNNIFRSKSGAFTMSWIARVATNAVLYQQYTIWEGNVTDLRFRALKLGRDHKNFANNIDIISLDWNAIPWTNLDESQWEK